MYTSSHKPVAYTTICLRIIATTMVPPAKRPTDQSPNEPSPKKLHAHPTTTVQQLLGVTPFGVYCQDCTKPLENVRNAKQHLKTHHPQVSIPYHLKPMFDALQSRMSCLAPDSTKFLVKPSVAPKCKLCDKLFKDDRAFRNHCQKKSGPSKSPCAGKDGKSLKVIVPVHVTCCGRITPAIENQLSPISTTNQTPPADSSSRFGVIPHLLQTTASDAEATLTPFANDNEPIKSLAEVFLPLLSTGVFDAKVRYYLEMMEPPDSPSRGLNILLSAGQDWLTENASREILLIPANIRAVIASFEARDNEGKRNIGSFSMRKKFSATSPELKRLICFLYRSNCHRFDTIKQQAAQSTLQQAIECAIVPKLIHLATMEQCTNVGTFPLIHYFCLARCFFLSGDQLKMHVADTNASTISTVLHLLRLGLCGVLVTLQSKSWADEALTIAKEMQGGTVINSISPIISRFRYIHSLKPPTIDNHVDFDTGDICCRQHIFKRSIWSTLIPRLVKDARSCFEHLLSGQTWPILLESSTLVQVKDWSTLDILFKNNDTQYDVSTITVLPVTNTLTTDYYLHRLQAIIELSFHGLGCGGVRHTEVLAMPLSSTHYYQGHCYFYSQPIKSFSLTKEAASKLVEHKLPLSLTRVFILFRHILVGQSTSTNGLVIPSFPTYKIKMVDLVKHLFDLTQTPDFLHIRHLWTNIHNYLFPKTDFNGILSAADSVSEMSGHSSTTQQNNYGTELKGWREQVYRRFHLALGEVTIDQHDDPQDQVFSTKQLLNCLRQVYGPSANFLSSEQQEMVELAANERRRHCFIGLPCGHGKSLTWTIPIVADRLTLKRRRMRIVVLPYKFLLSHMELTARRYISELSNVDRVKSYSGGDIQAETFPSELDDVDSRPSLVLLNLEAASHLLQYHFSRIKRWADEGTLVNVIVDEIQQLLCEFEFRQCYQELPKLAALGIPILILSGSLPKELSQPIARYLKLEDEDSQVTMKSCFSNNLVGGDFSFYSTKAKSITIGVYRQLLAQRKQSRAATHVICASKDSCEQIDRLLTAKGFRTLVVTSENTAEEQKKTAATWFQGQVDVLISTTVALVGNENEKCRTIIIAGLLFNISSLTQAIGRLRPNQRGLDASVHVIWKEMSPTKLTDMKLEDAKKLQLLTEAGVLRSSDRELFLRLFGTHALYNFTRQSTGCFLQTLSSFYNHPSSPCLRCGLCLSNRKRISRLSQEIPVKMAQEVAVSAISVQQSNTKTVQSLLRQLQERCFVCGSHSCDGTNCQRTCHRCGSSTHLSNRCSLEIASIIPPAVACFYCLVPCRYEQRHDVNTCTVKRRLRLLINKQGAQREGGTAVYLRSIFSSFEAFDSAVARIGRRSKFLKP